MAASNGKWKIFERDVNDLIRLQGWNVEDEKQIGPKRVDIYAEKIIDFGQRKRIAVECKAISRRLTLEQVTQIYSNYRPLLDKSLIDELLIVSNSGVTASAQTFCHDCRGLSHVSFINLLNSLMDFTTYLRGLKLKFKQDALSRYYMPQGYFDGPEQSPGDDTAESEIKSWIMSQNPNQQPIALLAGYGMGKTTLALRLSSWLAKQHQENPQCRIPILIRLEEISTETSLEGLIGKHLTSTSSITGYNFDTFIELNGRGRFVIFLDGFDEMKQAMSWDIMLYNFKQLNRLIVPNARVVIGGRPSAFLSEEEYYQALHGTKHVDGKVIKIPDWPDYREIHLAAFNKEEITRFIPTYLEARASEQAQDRNLVKRLIEQLTSRENQRLAELAERPVQLRMLLEVLPTWEGETDNLTVTTLYSEFIDLMIRREMEKHTRHSFTARDRRAFARELAWWMWHEGLGAIVTSQIPEKFFTNWFPKEGPFEVDGIRRDLLSACFLEVKQPDGYYFPHRSFQEFLVAEYLLNSLYSASFNDIVSKVTSVSSEIEGFITGHIGTREFAKLKTRLWKYRGLAGDWLINVFLGLTENPDELLEEISSQSNPWGLVILSIGLVRNCWDISIDQKEKIIETIFFSEAPSPEERLNYSKLQVVLILLLLDLLKNLNFDYKVHLRDLMRKAKTEEYVGEEARKVVSSTLMSSHLNSSYCCLQSWAEGSWRPSGAIKLRDQAQAPKGKHHHRHHTSKSPHRSPGVTRKKKW